MQPSKFPEICRLMELGEPVCISFEAGEGEMGVGIEGKEWEGEAELSSFLFCELVQKARSGETFRVSGQRCPAGAYVLGLSEQPPSEYYLKSGRYRDRETAEKAAAGLPRIARKYGFMRIEPLSENRGKFDVLMLFLTPEGAMRVVQAFAYTEGARVSVDTIGAASICGDCTALALEKGLGLSFGCKGSRKHSGYRDTDLPLGIAFETVGSIENGLSELPEVRA
ncbi:MAG: DUF169 domain-containing protein [Methanosarcinaceae archaeon]|nr:DUF169 domain-containing protein [Methanosarcinaceae archaeon]MDD4497524.1 DUF169 domain-containing protein [Methanosarcinaceae archaeon]